MRYVQFVLFTASCFAGYHIDSVGLNGGMPEPDSIHTYVVKFARNPPRYLTVEQIKCFQVAWVTFIICILIFILLLILQFRSRFKSKSVK